MTICIPTQAGSDTAEEADGPPPSATTFFGPVAVSTKKALFPVANATELQLVYVKTLVDTGSIPDRVTTSSLTTRQPTAEIRLETPLRVILGPPPPLFSLAEYGLFYSKPCWNESNALSERIRESNGPPYCRSATGLILSMRRRPQPAAS